MDVICTRTQDASACATFIVAPFISLLFSINIRGLGKHTLAKQHKLPSSQQGIKYDARIRLAEYSNSAWWFPPLYPSAIYTVTKFCSPRTVFSSGFIPQLLCRWTPAQRGLGTTVRWGFRVHSIFTWCSLTAAYSI